MEDWQNPTLPQNDLFPQLMKAFIEDWQDSIPPLKLRDNVLDKPLKAKNSDLYYGNLHIKCYYFCLQYEDHFKTAGAKSHKRVHFVSSFIKDKILFYWQQHKNEIEYNRAAPLSCEEFKAFFQKNLAESTIFINSIWNKIKKDSQYQLEEGQDWATHLKHV